MRSDATGAADGDAEVLFRIDDGVGWITFNRPQARNALTFGMYERLAEICREAAATGSVRALVLTGAGDKAFASGTDIAQFRAFRTAEDALEYEARIERILVALETCPIPTVAAIAGACAGGGAAIAACCDLRIGAASAKFGFPIARTLGNCLSMTNIARLTALIGPARVKDILFTARFVGAEEALSVGLLNEIVPDGGALAARAGEIARTVAGHAPLTLRATKEAVRRLAPRTTDADEKDLILMCYTSDDFREGMDAFLNKRAPRWQGR